MVENANNLVGFLNKQDSPLAGLKTDDHQILIKSLQFRDQHPWYAQVTWPDLPPNLLQVYTQIVETWIFKHEANMRVKLEEHLNILCYYKDPEIADIVNNAKSVYQRIINREIPIRFSLDCNLNNITDFSLSPIPISDELPSCLPVITINPEQFELQTRNYSLSHKLYMDLMRTVALAAQFPDERHLAQLKIYMQNTSGQKQLLAEPFSSKLPGYLERPTVYMYNALRQQQRFANSLSSRLPWKNIGVEIMKQLGINYFTNIGFRDWQTVINRKLFSVPHTEIEFNRLSAMENDPLLFIKCRERYSTELADTGRAILGDRFFNMDRDARSNLCANALVNHYLDI